MAESPGVTGAEFRDALARFATGVAVVTAAGPDGPHGVTVNAFASLSLVPPLVLVCIECGRLSHTILDRAGAFAVNFLASGQEALARFFSADDRPEGPGAFDGIAFHAGRTGPPLLDGCLASVECRIVARHPGGDHTIFVAAVDATEVVPARRPLLYYDRGYRAW